MNIRRALFLSCLMFVVFQNGHAMEKKELHDRKNHQDLMEKIDKINDLDSTGLTYFMKAALHGYTDIVELFIQNGAVVDAQNSFQETALMKATLFGHVECIKLIIQAGADVNARDYEDATALHEAAEMGTVECAKVLIEAGAMINAKNKYGMTPLHDASVKGNVACVKLFIESGADLNAQSTDGWTPLMLAVMWNFKECAKLILEAADNSSSSTSLKELFETAKNGKTVFAVSKTNEMDEFLGQYHRVALKGIIKGYLKTL